MSEAGKAKIGLAQRNLSSEQRANKSRVKIGELNPVHGMRWFTNGLTAKLFHPGQQPDGWILGRRPKRELILAPFEKQ